MPLPLYPPRNPKPVVIIHGLNDNENNLRFMEDHIQLRHPGTEVYRPNLYYGISSNLPLWGQIDRFGQALAQISAQHPAGVHLIGYSQGGMIARALLETVANHKVDTFVSVVGPLNGVYGETSLRNHFYYKALLAFVNKIIYTPLGQLCSVGNMWHDPRREELHLRANHFLPVLNNLVTHPRLQEFKHNFLQVKRVVLVSSTADTTITPWESSQFGFYNSAFEVEDLTHQKLYVDDTFGLRTLDQRGGLRRLTVTDIDHDDWAHDVNAIDAYILPWLT